MSNQFEFASTSNRDSDNPGVDTQRLINCYIEPAGNRSRIVFKSVLGEASGIALGTGVVRAFQPVKGRLYAFAGDTMHQIRPDGTTTSRGTFNESDEVSTAALGGAVCVASGGRMYSAYSGQDLTEIATTDARFDAIGAVTSTDNYLIATKSDSAEFMWSDLRDPESFPGLNFSTTDARDDSILRPMHINGNLWFFKKRSIEIWYPTGSSGALAFDRISGGIVDTGLKAFGLIAPFDGGAFFVGDDGIVYMTAGANIKPISRPAIETAIAQGDPSGCFYYEDEGHKFCVLRFNDRPAWVYDISTGLWHERSSDVTHMPWQTLATGKGHNRWYCGGFIGTVYRMERNNTDARFPLRRTAVSGTLMQNGNDFRVPEIKMYTLPAQVGVAATPVVPCQAIFQMQSVSGDVDEGIHNISVDWKQLVDDNTWDVTTTSKTTAAAFDFTDAEDDYITSAETGTAMGLTQFACEAWFRTPDTFVDREAVFTLQQAENTSGFSGFQQMAMTYDILGRVIFEIWEGDPNELPILWTNTVLSAGTDYYVGSFYDQVTEQWEMYVGAIGSAATKQTLFDRDYPTGNFPIWTTQAQADAVQDPEYVVDDNIWSVGAGRFNGAKPRWFNTGKVYAVRMCPSLPSGFSFGSSFTPDALPLVAPRTAERRNLSGYREAEAMISISRDHGHTWGDERKYGTGKLGEYDHFLSIRNNGQSRQFTMRIDVTDPVEVPVYATGYARLA